ncbi:MAG: CHAT domain-containing protein, partial [Trebonia sp.]
MDELRLEAREFTDLTRWRWVLRDVAGKILAEHDVRLDASCWQFEAFTDLRRYTWWHAARENRPADEARIVREVGVWTGAEVLGPVAPALLRRRPAVVRVVAPEPLLSRPLGLAHADGKPLAAQEITLSFQRDHDGAAPGKAAAGDRLRVLGLFSLPGSQPLGLRRERDALAEAVPGARILQYGVTRDRLRAVLAEGWDVVHVCGHGGPGGLLLETASGAPDPVSAADLAGLLDLTRDRVRLVTVFAAQPSAITVAEQRRRLGLPSPDHRAAGPPGADSAPGGALAARIAERLGCAVLATRYPVSGEFAAALTGALYPLLAGGLPLPQALGVTLKRLEAPSVFPALFPALSLAAPALFGDAAVTVTLPPGTPEPAGPVPARMTGFPPR